MKIATWNVNSIKVRISHVVEWVKHTQPDIVLLQELKTLEEQFPHQEIDELGYNVAVVGQKTYNGVAILSRLPIEVEQTSLPGDSDDDQARYLEALVGDVRVASIYLPNGNPINTPKFSYKLAWMDRLITHVRTLFSYEESFILGGDYNVCPTDDDVYDPAGFADDALCQVESRARFRELCHLGLTDALRALHPQSGLYTYWDYQAGRWNKDEGLRIDHLLLSPQAADRLMASGVDKGPRGLEKPSDHTPTWCELSR
ncbi:MAG: exodeoxyribonuclease III [Nitrospirales bacterium]|nr:exodeoxyribonuclease III [Nitrospira sp.]MDR4500742.1 exodeoxyribonuclease III [Nitrospirales bacterium]